ncbi:DUF3500 domain-containing protein [Microbacterium excoecariae]|uniref:DUF3500 domain-containing protein n=1 Tax=Microbacterium excoecariae TaxID=2715210 RepID=UPI00140D5D7E|nr:DUF3500 domain-containing protein [Microbacterium excoecariae]
MAWSGETTCDLSTGDGINFSISGPNAYVAFRAQQGSAGADVEGVTAAGWGHVHTICRETRRVARRCCPPAAERLPLHGHCR